MLSTHAPSRRRVASRTATRRVSSSFRAPTVTVLVGTSVASTYSGGPPPIRKPVTLTHREAVCPPMAAQLHALAVNDRAGAIPQTAVALPGKPGG